MAGAPVSKRQVITDYSPGYLNGGRAHGVRRVVLQLFGLLGHGKSSLINSSVYVVKGGGYQNLAESGTRLGGMTKERTEYQLMSKLVMIDNRGLSKLQAAEVLECSAQFRYLRELGEVTWTGISIRGASKVIAEGGKEPTDLIVPVFVQSCKIWNENDGKEIESLFARVHSITGIHPIVVFTHSSSGKPEDFKKRFEKFKSTQFFSLENYTRQNHRPNPETDGTIVDFLYACLMEAEARIKTMVGEDVSGRVVTQTTEQVREEVRVLRESLARMKHALQK